MIEAGQRYLNSGLTTPSRSFTFGVVCAAIFVVLSLERGLDRTSHVLAVIAIFAVVGVATLAAVMRVRASGGAIAGADEGFRALFGHVSSPALLTDRTGAILSVNEAAASYSGDSAAFVGDALSAFDPAATASCYRMLRDLGNADVADEILEGEYSANLRARLLGENLVVWSLVRDTAPKRLSWRGAPFAAALIDGDGAVAEGNDAWSALSGAQRRAVAEAAAAAVAAGRAHARAATPDGALDISIARQAQGSISVAATPARASAMEALDAALNRTPVAILRLSRDGDIAAVNAAGKALLGDEARAGRSILALLEGMSRPLSAQVEEVAASGAGAGPELVRMGGEDNPAYLQMSMAGVSVGGESSVLAVLSDATELKSLEEQFVQSQKMQAVGQLAGGVAHDFNNLLTAILGHCDLLMMRSDETAPEFADLTQIRQNAKRAAGLVRQLLAFSRKQTLRPTAVRVDDSLGELLHLLNRLLGETVTMRLKSDADLWPVWIDGQQFEQVVINLVVNARDAMPNGGEVTVRCFNTSFSADFARDRAVVPAGDYVCVEVHDTGHGIRPERLGKIFEPFYTTKRPGEGTGLGLSTAYGIIKQTGGFIFADSEVGEGSVLTIYLPRLEAEEAPAAPEADAGARRDLTGTGRVLLVEDEAPVRAFATRALRLRGYAVTEAENGEAALELLEDPSLKIDLMISDVVMPGMDGPTVARLARETRPELGVIFMSGYAEDVFRRGVRGVEPYAFLPKPFTLEELADMVKTALAKRGGDGDVGSGCGA